ncbi:uncharacterized protein LOC124551069 [Schistocerca americana]|uniref:uncharacterized protein LOC124551069 n=1 Tax=Schistocerca americana TaxID=7009 RepID=UPI001F4F12F5|nr:uncharacterized protein LOC124551069 [Schistocerca americana]
MDLVKAARHSPPQDDVGRLDTVSLLGTTTLQAPEKTNYYWSVCGLSACSEATEDLRSPIFSHPNSSKWCAELENDVGTPRMCFRLVASAGSQPVGVTLGASVSSRDGTECQAYRLQFCTLQIGERSPLQCIVDVFNGEDWLFEFEVEIVEVVSENISPPTWEVAGGLKLDLKRLWDSKKYTDFTLCAGGVQLEAHRAILSARSPVFAAMLRHDTKEAREGRVEITDVDPEVVSEILRYVYTDSVLLPSDITEKLLVAFDKYGLPYAKSECESELARKLTIDSAAITAACAILTSSFYLQEVCLAFIKTHLEKVVGTVGWADIIDQCPVAAKMISKLISGGSERYHSPPATSGSYSDATPGNSSASECVPEHSISMTCEGISDTVCDSGHTCCERKKVIYGWTVSGLNYWPEGREFVASPHFCHPESVRWELRLYKLREWAYEVRFHLLKSEGGRSIKVDLSVKEKVRMNCTQKTDCVIDEGSESQHCFPCKFFLQNTEGVRLECEISTVCLVQHWVGAIKPVRQSSFEQDLQSLRLSGNFVDFILCAGTVEMGAHRAILAARSPVFARMLQPGSEVSKKGRLEFPDMKPQILEKVLYYMYSAEANNLYWDASVELLVAFHRFELFFLCTECEYWVIWKLSRDRSVAVAVTATAAVFALENERDFLLEWTVDFIESNLEVVKGTREWSEATERHREAVERICQLVEERQRKLHAVLQSTFLKLKFCLRW